MSELPTLSTPVPDQTPLYCHCGHRLAMITDEFAPITEFRGIWCLDCLVRTDDDCGPSLESDEYGVHAELDAFY